MIKEELPFIKDMFNGIAPTYDLLNRLLSMFQDVYWRKILVHSLPKRKKMMILDVACGTGDVMLEIQKKNNAAFIWGLDFSQTMLSLAQNKITHQSIKPQAMNLIAANALCLPFKPQTLDAITIAFGIRNIQNKQMVLNQFYHVLKPNGSVHILELAIPEHPFLLKCYLLYFKKILPFIGRFLSKNNFAYHYLPDSVLHFPRPTLFMTSIQQAGFRHVSYQPLSFGITNLYIGKK